MCEPAKMYLDGSFLEKTGGTWHSEDSPFKADQIVKLLGRHPHIVPRSVCDIGCGAGRVLFELQRVLPNDVQFTGYDISPQAHELSRQYCSSRCKFVLGDAFADNRRFDLALVLDVVEHVEECFGFLRKVREKARFKIYHVPLDAHASAIVRGFNCWDDAGHLHLFTIETAMKTVSRSGQLILDSVLTPLALQAPARRARTRLINPLRRVIEVINRTLAARLLGGYSLLILAE